MARYSYETSKKCETTGKDIYGSKADALKADDEQSGKTHSLTGFADHGRDRLSASTSAAISPRKAGS